MEPDSSAWTGWEGLGGYLVTPPVAVNTPSGLYMASLGGGNTPWYRKRANIGSVWEGWTHLGGDPVAGQIGITGDSGPGPSGPQIFAKRADNRIYAVQITSGTWVPVGTQTFSGNPTPMAIRYPMEVYRNDYLYVEEWFDTYVLALGTDQKIYASRMNACDTPSPCGYGLAK